MGREAVMPIFVGVERTLPRLPATTSSAVVMEHLLREGVVVIEGALTPEQLAQVRTETAPWFEAAPGGAGDFFGHKTHRFSGVFVKAPSTADLAIHPLVLDAFEAVLRGPNSDAPVCDTIDLSATQAIGIGAGEAAQFLHRDDELFPFAHAFDVMANAMWAIDDFTQENGATRLVPGSHRWPRDRAPQPGDAITAEAPAGSAILWLGGVLHAGGANTTDQIRRGLVMSYKLGWLAPQEKLLLSIPPEAARAFPERLQQLIGYQLHKPNLGWIEGRDPREWLVGEVKDVAAAADNLTPVHEALLADVAARPDEYLAYLT